jgi:hypothetical protein
VSDGTRTRGRRDHNPELYQLSYAHQADCVANLAVRGHAKKARTLDRRGQARYKKRMLFMLVETPREPFDDGRRRPSREPWLVALLGWLLPWPALIVWLCAASRVLEGWVSVGCVYAAILLCAWRGLRALPTHGLNETRQ